MTTHKLKKLKRNDVSRFSVIYFSSVSVLKLFSFIFVFMRVAQCW